MENTDYTKFSEETVKQDTMVKEKKRRRNALVANCQKVNLRQTADIKSIIIAQLPQGTQVEIVTSYPNWTKVKTDNKIGFIMSIYLVEE